MRELRQNLSKYLDRVKAGESLIVTERGEEVARLIPSGVGVSAYDRRLAAQFGATLPTRNLLDVIDALERTGAAVSPEEFDQVMAERHRAWER